MVARRRVVLVGAGNIGARHAQAMARVSAPIDLDIVDLQPQARRRAQSLLAESGGLNAGAVREFERLDDIDDAPDLAIIATNSRERPAAVRAAVARGARSLILEKVLFTRLSDYDAIDPLLADGGVSAWVNCVNGTFPCSDRLAEFVDGSPFHYCVEGTGWSLGCNLIHFLDEFSSLSGRKEIKLSTAELDPIMAPAKRSGYVEFFGRISGETETGAKFAAICQDGAEADRTWTVTIDTGGGSLTVSSRQMLTIKDANGVRTEPYPIPLLSETSASHVDAILAGKAPRLPDYASASRLHRTMLSALLIHIRRVQGDETIDECPVT
jgi:Oxidoreductase family, NAD-binding Rossmann fold